MSMLRTTTKCPVCMDKLYYSSLGGKLYCKTCLEYQETTDTMTCIACGEEKHIYSDNVCKQCHDAFKKEIEAGFNG